VGSRRLLFVVLPIIYIDLFEMSKIYAENAESSTSIKLEDGGVVEKKGENIFVKVKPPSKHASTQQAGELNVQFVSSSAKSHEDYVGSSISAKHAKPTYYHKQLDSEKQSDTGLGSTSVSRSFIMMSTFMCMRTVCMWLVPHSMSVFQNIVCLVNLTVQVVPCICLGLCSVYTHYCATTTRQRLPKVGGAMMKGSISFDSSAKPNGTKSKVLHQKLNCGLQLVICVGIFASLCVELLLRTQHSACTQAALKSQKGKYDFIWWCVRSASEVDGEHDYNLPVDAAVLLMFLPSVFSGSLLHTVLLRSSAVFRVSSYGLCMLTQLSSSISARDYYLGCRHWL
jgi:hypothetical protein